VTSLSSTAPSKAIMLAPGEVAGMVWVLLLLLLLLVLDSSISNPVATGVPATDRVDAEDIRVSKNFVRLDFWMQTIDSEKMEVVKSYFTREDDDDDEGDAERY
jgi:hypothetical protein